jgi:hypothetical protein
MVEYLGGTLAGGINVPKLFIHMQKLVHAFPYVMSMRPTVKYEIVPELN